MKKRTWTDDELRKLVSMSSTWAEVLGGLGLDPEDAERGRADLEQPRRRAGVLGIDTSHLTRRWAPNHHGRVRRWSDEQLRHAVANSTTYAQVIRQLGLIPAGGNYDHVRREIVALGLDVTHFEKPSWKHTRKAMGKKHALELVLVANRPTGSHKLKLRLFRSGLKKQECELCGWAARAPDGRIPLELDHANGDKTDNRIENLRILCPNCHSLQPTHRGLNQKRRKRPNGD